MNDVNKDNNPGPMFSCRYQRCAEEFSYPAEMLAMHPQGGVVCSSCFDYEEREPDELTWDDLPAFKPITTASVGSDSDEKV